MGNTSAQAPSPGIDRDRRRLLVSFVIGSVAGLVGSAAPADERSASPSVADWQHVLATMFPHARLDRALYAIPAGALIAAADKDAATRGLLAQGWRTLSAAAGGDFAAATDEARTRAVASIVGTPLFTVLRQTTVFTFYADPKVWDSVGYDGDAWRFGGFLGKGLVTIDWLPDPPAAAKAR